MSPLLGTLASDAARGYGLFSQLQIPPTVEYLVVAGGAAGGKGSRTYGDVGAGGGAGF